MTILTFWLITACLYHVSAATSAGPHSLPSLPLPAGIEEAYVDCVSSTGLIVHVLMAGCDSSRSNPLVLLLHGFPELAYTWRHVMPRLASHGYCVVAPDLRGGGRTTGWDTRPYSKTDLSEFSNTNMVRDLVSLVYGLGYTKVFSVVGHDYGAIIAAWAALMRPDMFRSSVHVTNPFDGAPLPAHPAPIHSDMPSSVITATSKLEQQEAALQQLQPPRKYYQVSNAQSEAANDWNTGGSLGLREFLRRYFYVKSADWPGNHPHSLPGTTAEDLAVIPHYYVMLLNESMSATVGSLTKECNLDNTHTWLPEEALDVYVSEYQRVGFQGQLNWYRVLTSTSSDLLLMAGRKIEGPVIFISGDKDWGSYQHPGALERYNQTCSDFRGRYFVPGAGHWVQLEQPEALTERILAFLKTVQ